MGYVLPITILSGIIAFILLVAIIFILVLLFMVLIKLNLYLKFKIENIKQEKSHKE